MLTAIRISQPAGGVSRPHHMTRCLKTWTVSQTTPYQRSIPKTDISGSQSLLKMELINLAALGTQEALEICWSLGPSTCLTRVLSHA